MLQYRKHHVNRNETELVKDVDEVICSVSEWSDAK